MYVFGGREDVVDDYEMDFSTSCFDSVKTIELRYQSIRISLDMLSSAPFSEINDLIIQSKDLS